MPTSSVGSGATSFVDELERQLGEPKTAGDVKRWLALDQALKPGVRQLAESAWWGDFQSADGREAVSPAKLKRKVRVLVSRALAENPSHEELEVFL